MSLLVAEKGILLRGHRPRVRYNLVLLGLRRAFFFPLYVQEEDGAGMKKETTAVSRAALHIMASRLRDLQANAGSNGTPETLLLLYGDR